MEIFGIAYFVSELPFCIYEIHWSLDAYIHFILPTRYEGSLFSHGLYSIELFFDKKPLKDVCRL